jgi:hypothetical protein
MILQAALALAINSSAPPINPLLDDLEHRAVRFFWEQSNPANGFSKDRASNKDGVDEHTIASCASVGFALASYCIGAERSWLTRQEALERTRVTLSHLNSDWPQHHGWLYHFVDWKTGARQWNCEVSTIDTSICLAGVIDAEQYWKDSEVTDEAEKFIHRIDWNYMITDDGGKPKSLTICMGWSPERQFIPSRWDNWDELKMIYVQAYGLSDVSTDGWAQINRPPVLYKGIYLITGGPLFMHEMSESFYSFKGQRDMLGYNYWVESKNAAMANRQYCIDNPKNFAAYGPNFWGLSACDVPGGYDAEGAPGWISDNGTITPTSAVASIQFIPDKAISFADAMRHDHPEAWGRYGFPNGYCPNQKWVDPDVIGIDLGMMMTAVENVRSGLMTRLSSQSPIVKRGMERMGFVKSNDDFLIQR